MNQEMAPLNKTEGDADENNQPQVADNPWSKKLPKAYFGLTTKNGSSSLESLDWPPSSLE